MPHYSGDQIWKYIQLEKHAKLIRKVQEKKWNNITGNLGLQGVLVMSGADKISQVSIRKCLYFMIIRSGAPAGKGE